MKKQEVHIRNLHIGNGRSCICVPITARDLQELDISLDALEGHAGDMVEWRADFFEEIPDRETLADLLKRIRRRIGARPLLFTYRTRKEGGRIICVGTTSCRTLETAADEDGMLRECSGWTDIFIYPGYRFRCIDALITNFHLPESTLIMLVSALAGREHVLHAYEVAVENRYRFFSFGDAMFLS